MVTYPIPSRERKLAGTRKENAASSNRTRELPLAARKTVSGTVSGKTVSGTVFPLLEASGGVTLANVRAIARTGVERISVGALTHSAKAVDIRLEIEPST